MNKQQDLPSPSSVEFPWSILEGAAENMQEARPASSPVVAIRWLV